MKIKKKKKRQFCANAWLLLTSANYSSPFPRAKLEKIELLGQLFGGFAAAFDGS